MTDPDDSQADQPSEPQADEQPNRGGGNRGLSQAYQLRDLAAEQALALNTCALAERETMSQRAQAIASLVKAWDYASDRLRIMRNRPLPGSLRPERPDKSKTRKPSRMSAPALAVAQVAAPVPALVVSPAADTTSPTTAQPKAT